MIDLIFTRLGVSKWFHRPKPIKFPVRERFINDINPTVGEPRPMGSKRDEQNREIRVGDCYYVRIR